MESMSNASKLSYSSGFTLGPRIAALTFGVTASTVFAGAPVKPVLPPDVARFVAQGAVAIELEDGDINGDGVMDYLLVVENPTGTRDLLILVRRADGSLKLAARNKTIIECGVCEGQGGDFRVIPVGNGFDVEDTTGAGDVGRKLQFKFKYLQQEASWVLIEVDDERYDGQALPKKQENHVQMPYQHGKVIRFEAFKGEEFGVAWSP